MIPSQSSASTAIRLIPVVELEAISFATEDGRQIGLGGDWNSFWLRSSDNPTTTRLFPMKPGWNLVTIDQLKDPRVLEILVRMLAADREDDSAPGNTQPVLGPDNFCPLSGGFALCIGDEVIITPQCCSDLSDIESWRTAAVYRDAHKVMVWIGHPWVMVRFDGVNLIFAGDDGLVLKPLPECAVEPDALSVAVTQAWRELEALADRLLPVVERFVPQERARETARRLAGIVP